LNLRTNCSADARISSSVAGGSKFARVLMLRHIRRDRNGSSQYGQIAGIAEHQTVAVDRKTRCGDAENVCDSYSMDALRAASAARSRSRAFSRLFRVIPAAR